MYVHGGAYNAGHKDESYQADLLQTLVDKGFAVASFNYILGKGIMPQVFWDFEDSARFLRMHAKKYNLDPCAFGAIGISAGGWLITSSGHADGTTIPMQPTAMSRMTRCVVRNGDTKNALRANWPTQIHAPRIKHRPCLPRC